MEIKEIGFEARWMAQKILNDMKKMLEHQAYVTVADYYELANVTPGREDRNWGWADLSGVVVMLDDDTNQYVLTLPEEILIDCGVVDMVNHPPHYQSKNGLEAIDVIESFTADLKGGEATNTGNVLKYMLRWKGKNGLQDLRKAEWYLKRLINLVENNMMESENNE